MDIIFIKATGEKGKGETVWVSAGIIGFVGSNNMPRSALDDACRAGFARHVFLITLSLLSLFK